MCGIAGFAGINRLQHSPEEIIRRMTDTIIHRGPDAHGAWSDRHAGVALGHRRLSIVDLSASGNQPMVSPGGRYVIVFNGEIYNFRDLRAELDATQRRSWRGGSDTEVLLTLVEDVGIERALQRLVGMFAFALWDRETYVLTLVRDRLGEKPLYYGWCQGNFVFASELKALRAHPSFDRDIDRNALALFLRHNYIPAPFSIYQGVYKLPPGTFLTITAGRSDTQPREYWSVRAIAEEGQSRPFAGSAEEAADGLEALLRRAISQQMVADVPVGAFLSGGIDSSLVVALMQAQSTSRVRTFTVGFHDEKYNEAEAAKAVARHLGTDHMELYVSPQDALAVIPRLPYLYDEPFSDSSQIPTFLIAGLTRRHVTVSLSGDGGDELFGGYPRYLLCDRLWRKVGWVPAGVRSSVAGLFAAVPNAGLDACLSPVRPVAARYGRPGLTGAKLKRWIEMASAGSPELLYRSMVSHWKNPEAIVIDAVELLTALTGDSGKLSADGLLDRLMYLDLMTYLPDDILVKVDRAAMGVSLETRVPLLDHRIVEYAFSLPSSIKIRNGTAKWPLRKILGKYVPQEIAARPKKGFGVPIGAWLRGPLREWADSLLDGQRLIREGYFRPGPILKKWHEHRNGITNWDHDLWNVLMYQAWLEAQGKQDQGNSLTGGASCSEIPRLVNAK